MLFNIKTKVSKTAFTEDQLPKNRKELFNYLVKNRLSLLIDLGFTVLLFSLPLILINVFYNILSADLKVKLAQEKAEEIYLQLYTLNNLKNILYLVGLIILSIGLSGVYQIIRKLIFQENIMKKLDFKEGIKSNFKVFCPSLLIIGLLNLIIQYLLFSNIDTINGQYKVVLGIVIALIVILTPVLLITLSHSTIYNLPFIYRIKNGFLFIFLKFYIFIPLGILNLGFLFVQYIPGQIVYFLSLLIIPLLSSFIILFNNLICDNVFDEYINKENYPTIYRKGLNKNE